VSQDADGGVDVRILVDGSIVELFVAGTCITAWVYPTTRTASGRS